MCCRPSARLRKRQNRRTLSPRRGKPHTERSSRCAGKSHRPPCAKTENPSWPRSGCSLCKYSFFPPPRPRTRDSRGRRENRSAHDVCQRHPRAKRTRIRAGFRRSRVRTRRPLVRRQRLRFSAARQENPLDEGRVTCVYLSPSLSTPNSPPGENFASSKRFPSMEKLPSSFLRLEL